MSDEEPLVARAHETLVGWLALGHESTAHPLARIVRDARTPIVYDANFAAEVRARTPDEIEALLAEVDCAFAGLGHRHFYWDPGMPQPFETRLLLDGYSAGTGDVILVLEGELRARGPRVELRAVESDADWAVLEALHRLDHEEEAAKGFHRPWQPEVTRQLVLAKRAKAPAVRYVLARADGVDCAFFSAWPGENGVGKVEDLFTRSDFRGRGIATALIAACVDDARARGAGPVLIGARGGDTPKHMYKALGFRPLCVERNYVRTDLLEAQTS
ncbi:MAG TPA: GNAT family N-acetyltransferase [Myxococcota bacterium]|nr:GNAT family N-acetyltransferase [Myxococcota bacterium]